MSATPAGGRAATHEPRPSAGTRLPFVLFFVSGAAGLVYEVLWARQLSLVLGNTAEVTATVLAAYFIGVAIGQHAAGRRADRWRNPLRAYGWLELATAASAAVALIGISMDRALYPHLFATFADRPFAFDAAKLCLAITVLLAPTVCMGATLPAIGRFLVRERAGAAARFGLLYAVQTLGGASGALAAAFYLTPVLGISATYAIAVGLSAATGCVALAVSGTAHTAGEAHRPQPQRRERGVSRPQPMLALLALVSGFASMGVEVLWTHMFARVLHNSVYSFAVILVTFLLALGLGGLAAGGLARRAPARPRLVVSLLLSGAALAVAATPFVFCAWTGGLSAVRTDAEWGAYVGAVFAAAAIVMLVPGVLIGSVFPYLLALEERPFRVGAVIGWIASLNTVGAIAGSIGTAFVVLPWLGLWSSMRALAIVYVGASLAVSIADRGARRLLPLPAGVLLLVATVLDPTRLPVVHVAPQERLVEVLESASGIVAVIERGEILSMELDGHYSLGANGAIANDRRLGELPLLLHPAPRSVFFLGMGTGITAGAALFHPLERVTTCELIGAVADAARRYFAPYTNGLFVDPRSRVVIADGRNFLLGSDDRYDVVIAELFVPWHAGTGSLYTREHFAAVRDRLTRDGVFAQWLPLYQMSRREVSIVARTMLDVFPQVTLWRGDLLPRGPVVALVGHASAVPLDLDAVVANVRRRQGGSDYPAERAKALAMAFYAGNVGAARALFADAPLNTDDHPQIEYVAPLTQNAVDNGRASWLTGDDLLNFYADIAAAVPWREDPYLARLTDGEIELAQAGSELYRASVDRSLGRVADAHREFDEFARRVPPDVAKVFAGMIEGQ